MELLRIPDLGLGEVCRACLSDEGEMKSVFDYSTDNSEVQISKMFECISALQINEKDGLPGVICLSCELRLNNAYSFHELCQRTSSTLAKYVENAMKYSVEQSIEHIEVDEKIVIDIPDESKVDVVEYEEPTLPGRNAHYSAEVVEQAILDTRQKHNGGKRECRLCGFEAKNPRGLSLHIAHLHKELKDKWCNVCYEEVEDLLTHMDEHNKSKPFHCSLCEKTFSSQGHLTEHIKSHSIIRPFKCDSCDKGFLTARHLRVHKRIHTGDKPFACPYCERRFTQNGALQGHIRTHRESRNVECLICSEKFPSPSDLAEHVSQSGHTKLEPRVTKQRKRVVAHSTTQEDKESMRKLCTVCGKTFSASGKLRLHMRIHTGETPYKCQYCDKRFISRCQMVVHTRVHTGEKPHVCHVCGKGFAQSSVLNTHMKLHTGRPEQCQICQQRFCRPAELRLHMRKHTGEKPYLCTVCGQAFIQRSHLMEHIKIHSDERPYQCHLCERAFKQSSSLKSHIQIHTGYKPYKCSQCPYACRQPYSLTQHMKQHSADFPQSNRPFQCLVCQRAFTTQAMLTSHTRTVHQAIF